MNGTLPPIGMPPGSGKHSRPIFLRVVLVVLTVAPVVAALAIGSELSWMARLIATMTWILCLCPAYAYLFKQPGLRRPLPFLPAISLVYGLYFALPIVLGSYNRAWRAQVDPTIDYDYPVQLVFFGWVAMMTAYAVTGALFPKHTRSVALVWRPKIIAKWGLTLLVAGIAVNALRALLNNSLSIGGILQLFVSMQWLGIGLLTVLARRGELSRIGQVTLVTGFLVAVGVALAQGNISPVAMLCVVVGFGLWIGRPVIEPRWVIAAVVAALVAVTFRGSMRDFRMIAWYQNTQLTQAERVGLAARLVEKRIREQGLLSTVTAGAAVTAQRSAAMDLFADVVRRTPDQIPYWNGQTYYSLIGLAVPRFLWPDKPTKELGQAFGHRYEYLHSSNLSTSINFPFLVEFYANFGGRGVLLGMLLVGLIYRVLDQLVNRPGQSALQSMFGVTLLLPMFLIESDFSLIFGGIPLTGVALFFLWRTIARQLGERSKLRTSARVAWAPTQDKRLPRSIEGIRASSPDTLS